MKVIGASQHSARLRRLTSLKAQAEITRELFVGGTEIELEAERSITEGSISGAGHVPSRPGQPPNADTRELDTSIDTTVRSQNPPRVNVEASAPHAVPQEFGTSRMEERPYMRPATTKKRGAVVKRIAAAVRRLARK